MSAVFIHLIIITIPRNTRSHQEVEDLQRKQKKLEERLNNDFSSINDAVVAADVNELEVLLAQLRSRVERWDDVTRHAVAMMDEDDRSNEVDRCEDNHTPVDEQPMPFATFTSPWATVNKPSTFCESVSRKQNFFKQRT